jgi:VWFA-related protein
MKRLSISFLSLILMVSVVAAQTPAQPQQQTTPDDVLRITTALVQTDAVVVDKNDRIVPDLKLEDFELYENGKKQDLKFMEFVSVDTGRRAEGERPIAAAGVNTEVARDLTAKELKRVIAFVVDDLTIPYADLNTVRQVLSDFVENQMREGDLVAIVRVVGGKGLLQQFTSDKALLRRAIASLNITTNPFAAFNNPTQEGLESIAPATDFEAELIDRIATASNPDTGNPAAKNPTTASETRTLFRGLFALSTANFVIESLKQLPGRKSLVLFSGGLPVFGTQGVRTVGTDITDLLNRLVDNAARAGVVINTMDPRGLKATPGVIGFEATPGRGSLRSPDPSFGRGGSETDVFGPLLAGGEEQLSLRTLSSSTGGVAVVNTNNFKGGLDKVLVRSSGYYLLAYTPADKFDNKFREIKIRVKREGLRVYTHKGYIAKDERETSQPKTKEEAILAAALSPLARRDVNINSNLTLRLTPANRAALNIDLVIDPKKLSFTKSAQGKHQASFDVVGFVYDQVGKLRGGFSDQVNLNLSPESYQQTLSTGVAYTAGTELPPGYYQLRMVVREASTGNMGTATRYLEVPDLKDGRLAMSSILLYAIDPTKGASATPQLLDPLLQISPASDLRYAATVFNAKREGGKHQLRSQIIISQGTKVLFREEEQLIGTNSGDQVVTKIGQLGLSKVRPGKYLLTLIITDPLADKKSQKVARSAEFTVVR